MASFNWGKCYETGLPTVDKQHHALVDLINHYGELLTAGERIGAPEIDSALQQLTDYAHYHFREEERMMVQAGLERNYVREHKHFHADFLHEVTLMKDGMGQGQTQAEQLLKFLTHWLAYHILGTDQSMARQMAAMAAGKSAEQAYLDDQQEKENATGPLLLALNGLFQQINERNRELRELNSLLEAKVAERTQALRLANEQLSQLAMSDSLTGLPNRRLLEDRLRQAMATGQRSGRCGALMFIDLDNFKPLNDSQGHEVGDLLLIEVAHRLVAGVRQIDTVARIGGDEFVVLLSALDADKARSDAQAHSVAEKLRISLAAPYKLSVKREGRPDVCVEHRCSASMGVLVFGGSGQSQEEILKLADAAMYRAKEAGRNRIEFASVPGASPGQATSDQN